MSVTIETSGDAEEIVELLRQVHDEHRQRRPQWFKPFDRTAALEGQRFLLSRDGAQMFVARVEGVCVGYALVCERVREENPFRYASRSLMVDQMAVSMAQRRRALRRAADGTDPGRGRLQRRAARGAARLQRQ